jgi:hypothetical protein
MANAHCMLDTKGYKHTLKYVIFIAFPRQQWLRERASVLRYSSMPAFLLYFNSPKWTKYLKK